MHHAQTKTIFMHYLVQKYKLFGLLYNMSYMKYQMNKKSCSRAIFFLWKLHPRFWWGPCWSTFFGLLFCAFCFVCLRPGSCVPNVASFYWMLSLDCSFLIAPSVFSNVYLPFWFSFVANKYYSKWYSNLAMN